MALLISRMGTPIRISSAPTVAVGLLRLMRPIPARRELREETGYSAREWAFAGRLSPTVAYSDEIIDIWFARGLTLGARQLDEEEFY